MKALHLSNTNISQTKNIHNSDPDEVRNLSNFLLFWQQVQLDTTLALPDL